MKRLGLIAALLAAAESAALACSCVTTDDPAELRRMGEETGKNAVALVQVEVIRAYDPATGQGETMRVRHLYAGTAPLQFQVPRGHFPSGASCDVEYRVGQRDEVILYPAPEPNTGNPRSYRMSGLCTDHLLDRPEFRQAVIDAIGRNMGERG